MKNQGGKRVSPAEQVVSESCFYCPQCNLKLKKESDLEEHVKSEHREKPSCPFCLVGFHNLGALRSHIEQHHGENTPISRETRHSNQPQSGRQAVKRGICIFFLQSQGCKKGNNCDFSHERGGQYSSVKIRKVCRNGPHSNWKPRCRYVHPEDGEIIPPREESRAHRVESRVLREEDRRPSVQDFRSPNHSQPPPENILRNYPVLGQPEKLSMFRPWTNTDGSH